MTKPTLQIIIGSTRPGRVGPAVASWFYDCAVKPGTFDVELIDLAEVNLPMFNEPKHPRFGEYTYQHTKDWSATIRRGDAYVFVLPEYNYAFNAALKNAIDYLHTEWQYKPVGFVSYGGVAAGTRAVQMLKQVVTALKMVPVTEAVNIPFVQQFLDDQRVLVPNEIMQDAAGAMLAELARWAGTMAVLRQPRAS